MSGTGFHIEVLVREGHKEEWQKLRPTNGPPYLYRTYREAERDMEMVGAGQLRNLYRIVKAV